ncbi:MAG: PA14 domain-containing protein [Adhaeribacter sp.]
MKYLKGSSILLFASFLFYLASCSLTTPNQALSSPPPPNRPREPWVMRLALDDRPRILGVALHPKLWLAYSTQTASLYKAWAGRISFNGRVYNTGDGMQPASLGITYLEEPEESPWLIRYKGQDIIPSVQFKGHSLRNNQVTLRYELHYEGQQIKLEERPEVIAGANGEVKLERVFKTSQVPSGAQVTLRMHLNSLPAETAYSTDGAFAPSGKSSENIQGKSYHQVAGSLMLNRNGYTVFTVALAAKPAVVKPKQAKLSQEQIVAAIMDKSDCNTCHNRTEKTIGPAYTAIAQKYQTSPQTQEMLVQKVIQGGAGNWGQVPMTPHPDLSKEDAGTLVAYILSLDAEAEKIQANNPFLPKPTFDIRFEAAAPRSGNGKEQQPGIAFNAYQFSQTLYGLPDITADMLPLAAGKVNALHAFTDADFQGLKRNFAVHASGYLNLKQTTRAVLRLVSDDGARLFIDDKLVLDHALRHELSLKEADITLKAGRHAFRVEYYQDKGNKGLSLQWKKAGTKEFSVIPPEVFTHQPAAVKKVQKGTVKTNLKYTDGDGVPLKAVHPAFTLAQARPASFKPRVGAMDFMPDGRLVVSTWDSVGAVYILEGVQGNNPEAIQVKRIASGLAEPLGLKVVDGDIYVMQKQELTRLVDLNKDDVIDEYQTVCNAWRVSANFHEFAFGLLYQDGYFYGTLATAINPGGSSTQPQIPDRGKAVRIAKKDGSLTFLATGLRTPNGIGFGVDNEMFIADNQGDWLPSNKIVHLKEGAWYGSRSVDFPGTQNLTETPPVVWLAQDDIGNSPTQPVRLDVGPYKNQMIHGDVTHGGIKRVFAEKVNGNYQGAVFRFCQGLEAGVNRLVWGPDGNLYVGGIGSIGNWFHAGKLGYGLQKLSFNGQVPFEMLAVRAKANGLEIEFTEPLQPGAGLKPTDYTVRQWWYKPTARYGGPKMDEEDLHIRRVDISSDRKKVFLELKDIKPGHVVYLRLNLHTMKSKTGRTLWTTEAWYTLNSIPQESGKLSKN